MVTVYEDDPYFFWGTVSVCSLLLLLLIGFMIFLMVFLNRKFKYLSDLENRITPSTDQSKTHHKEKNIKSENRQSVFPKEETPVKRFNDQENEDDESDIQSITFETENHLDNNNKINNNMINNNKKNKNIQNDINNRQNPYNSRNYNNNSLKSNDINSVNDNNMNKSSKKNNNNNRNTSNNTQLNSANDYFEMTNTNSAKSKPTNPSSILIQDQGSLYEESLISTPYNRESQRSNDTFQNRNFNNQPGLPNYASKRDSSFYSQSTNYKQNQTPVKIHTNKVPIKRRSPSLNELY